ncbi:MAG: hypothetical protein M3461_23730 [Pseudomonadota bacterium]|nr:hypothetical protein [Pseudomonadota bacterium]
MKTILFLPLFRRAVHALGDDPAAGPALHAPLVSVFRRIPNRLRRTLSLQR